MIDVVFIIMLLFSRECIDTEIVLVEGREDADASPWRSTVMRILLPAAIADS